MSTFKSGFVAIVGKANAGKSNLMNKLIGNKVAIVSPKPQTTRNKIVGILTEKDYQIIFLDTPGIFKPKNVLGEYMMKNVESATKDVDFIIVVIDSAKGISNEDEKLIQKYSKNNNIIVVLSKVDIADKEKVGEQIQKLSSYDNLLDIVPVSAKKNINIDELKDVIVDNLEEGYKYYNDDMITDKPERFLVSEIIREKALLCYQNEIPHGISVGIEQMKYNEKKNMYEIYADIICEKDSHKAIIIGKRGEALKRVATMARQDIEKTLDAKVFLNIWIKVKENWRDNNFVLKEVGYDSKEI